MHEQRKCMSKVSESFSVEDRSLSSGLLCEQPLYSLLALPIELLVYIFSLVPSTRDRVKLRYVSQRIRTAAETPSLWRDFIWPHLDFREVNSIKSVFNSCGRHMTRLSFPDFAIPIKLLQEDCGNLIHLSLPSANLNLSQLRIVMQFMKKLQYLDILWSAKNDVEDLATFDCPW